jgi:serine protease Do
MGRAAKRPPEQDLQGPTYQDARLFESNEISRRKSLMLTGFPNGQTAKNKMGLMATFAAASLLLLSAPALTRAQGPAPGFPPPGFGNFAPGGGWLGVAANEITPDKAKELKLPEGRGVSLDQVDENSPAAKAGLQKGDVVNEYDGQRVEGVLQFQRLVRETPPGRTVKISVWRGGKNVSLSVVVGDLASRSGNSEGNNFRFNGPPNGPQGAFGQGPGGPGGPGPGPGGFGGQGRQRGGGQNLGQTPALGVSAIDLSGQLAGYFGVQDGGVLVTDVRANSAGEKAGLKAGDVITKLGAARVHNLDELRTQLGAQRDANTVTVTVIRKGSEMSLTVTPERPQPRG